MVYYSQPEQRNYNEKSKENLKQYEVTETEKLAELIELQEVQEIDCPNEYAKKYLLKYEEIKAKNYKRTFSQQQRKKISDSTNTFIDTVKFNYKESNGFNQRMITFVTLTLPENQKHTDKVLVKTLVDFIDHLKKVKNTLIENKIDTGKELLRLEHYIWRAETTETGNIHFHLLFDTYVNHQTLKRVWNVYLLKLGYSGGENAASIHNLKSVKDVGGYVTKYLTKEPLNDEFEKLLKTGQISRADLDNYDDQTKYRRPVLYTSWGSSRALKSLSCPTFEGAAEVVQFNELKLKCTPVELSDDLKDYVKIYKGKIYELLKTCNFKIKSLMAGYFRQMFKWLYAYSDDERNDEVKLKWLHSLSQNYFYAGVEFSNVVNKPVRQRLVMDSLF